MQKLDSRKARSVDLQENGRRRTRGFDTSRPVGSFIEVVRGVLFEPARFFAGLTPRQEGVWAPLILAGICFVISAPLSLLSAPLDPLAPEDVLSPLFSLFSLAQDSPGTAIVLAVFLLLLVPLFVALSVYLGTAIHHLFILLFVRQQRGFPATFLVVAYGSALQLLSWIPVLGYLATLYGIYVFTVGLREVHGTTTTQALLAALVPSLLALVWFAYALF